MLPGEMGLLPLCDLPREGPDRDLHSSFSDKRSNEASGRTVRSEQVLCPAAC